MKNLCTVVCVLWSKKMRPVVACLLLFYTVNGYCVVVHYFLFFLVGKQFCAAQLDRAKERTEEALA